MPSIEKPENTGKNTYFGKNNFLNKIRQTARGILGGMVISGVVLAGNGCATIPPKKQLNIPAKKPEKIIAPPHYKKGERAKEEIEKGKENWIMVYAEAIKILERKMMTFANKYGRKTKFKKFYQLALRKVYKITQDYRKVVMGEKMVHLDLKGSSVKVIAIDVAHNIMKECIKESGIFESDEKKLDMKQMRLDVQRLMEHYKSLKHPK